MAMYRELSIVENKIYNIKMESDAIVSCMSMRISIVS